MINSKLWEKMVPHLSYPRRFWKRVLWLIALILVIVCLMRPQYGSKFEKVVRKGQDIFIILDTSASMLAQDIQPSRLESAVK